MSEQCRYKPTPAGFRRVYEWVETTERCRRHNCRSCKFCPVWERVTKLVRRENDGLELQIEGANVSDRPATDICAEDVQPTVLAIAEVTPQQKTGEVFTPAERKKTLRQLIACSKSAV